MAADALKGFMRLGILVGGCGLLLVFLEPPGSIEFVLSLCSALTGIALVVGVFVVSRMLRD